MLRRDKRYLLKYHISRFIIRPDIYTDMTKISFVFCMIYFFFLRNRNMRENKINTAIKSIFDIAFSFICNYSFMLQKYSIRKLCHISNMTMIMHAIFYFDLI